MIKTSSPFNRSLKEEVTRRSVNGRDLTTITRTTTSRNILNPRYNSLKGINKRCKDVVTKMVLNRNQTITSMNTQFYRYHIDSIVGCVFSIRAIIMNQKDYNKKHSGGSLLMIIY